MENFLDEFMKNFGADASDGLSSNLGIKRQTANQIIPEVLPLILGGLKRQKDTRGGADRIDHILNKYGKADVLDRIGDHDFTAFTSLFQLEEGRMGVVVSLLAVLELIKESLIELVQSEPFAPIYIKAAGSTAVLEEEPQAAAAAGES